jgi:hypothetical protein
VCWHSAEKHKDRTEQICVNFLIENKGNSAEVIRCCVRWRRAKEFKNGKTDDSVGLEGLYRLLSQPETSSMSTSSRLSREFFRDSTS